MLGLWIGVAGMALVGLLAACLGRWASVSRWLGGMGLGVASVIAAVPLVGYLAEGVGAKPVLISLPWGLPLGCGSLALDSLSAFFGLLIVGVTGLAAVYGIAYLRHDDGHRRTGGTWLLLGLLEASMLGVVLAHDGVVFLLSWELMTLSSFGLVVFDHHLPSVRHAGLVYLIAGHLGAACLFVLFLWMANGDPTLAFERMQVGPWANLCFVLAVVGFGTKAGLLPLHVWLPEAHSSAPSHVSAVMSGVMLKTGIYGVIRVVSMLGEPVPAWWGVTLAVLGAAGGVIGILFALAQQDVKRVLAYSSVENIGIIFMALGVGLLGKHLGQPALEWLGFGAALLHSLNHSLFKTMLFFGAGALMHSVGTRQLDMLGGLAKRLPTLAVFCLVGAVAISGLPPLNGFVSEVMVYAGAWQSIGHASRWVASISVGVVLALALIGGLAVACFTRLCGAAFLGEPRSEMAAHAHPVSALMLVPMGVLALGCLVVGLGSWWFIGLLAAPLAAAGVKVAMPPILDPILHWTSLLGAGLLGLVLLLWLLRNVMGGTHEARRFGTWDCGYAQPTARMQYTASSFAQPLTDMFSWLLRTKKQNAEPLTEPFPDSKHFLSHTDDLFLNKVFHPAFHGVDRLLSVGRVLQGGRVQVYILYMLVTLIILLAYQMEG